MPDEITLSVVLPVYAAVPAHQVRQALASIFGQTFAATEVIVVEDGPLTEEQLEAIAEFEAGHEELKRIRLRENQGPGVANQQGLLAATSEWIAKADADDVCLPTRFEKQVAAIRDGQVDLLGTAMHIFKDTETQVTALRRMPARHDEIARAMKMNNPINHPTVMFRRSMALDAGGYPAMRHMEDYDMCARMLVTGARLGNLDEALVLFRANDGMYRRRTSLQFMRCELQLQQNLRRYGLIGPVRMVVNLALRLSFGRLPQPLLRLAYRVLFHRKR